MKLTSHPLVCQEAVELMSDYVEGSLTRRDRKRLEKHLAACPHCSLYLEQIRLTIAASGVVRAEDLDPGALDELTDVFRKFHDQPDED
jgi:anti-sigma factor RsiW